MKITLKDGRKIFIEFKYRYIKKQMSNTTAIIEVTDLDGTVNTYSSIALVHPEEVGNRINGRKVALRYAFRCAGLDLPTRTEIWELITKQGMKLFSNDKISVTRSDISKIHEALDTAYKRLDCIDPEDKDVRGSDEGEGKWGVAIEKKEIHEAIKLVNGLMKRRNHE